MATAVTSTCACRGFSVTVEFPNSELPMNRALCLCNNCRRVSGSCGWSSLLVPPAQMFDPSKFNTTTYETSKGVARHFCSICGAHTFTMIQRGQSMCVLNTGLWDRTEGLINWTGCKWVDNTLDGGISVWFKNIKRPDGTTEVLKRWARRDAGDVEFVPEGSLMTMPKKEEILARDDKLKAGCHCGGVKFYITRPDEASKKVQSPYSDLITPYHSHSSENPKNEAWWLRQNDTKYLAGTCACTSCRLATGCEIQPWAFVPKCNISQEDGTPLDFAMGTLKSYQSSEGVLREFCGVCGATVFWHCEERPELIDVSVGVLDPEEGARVEGWLDWWTDRVSFEELALSKDLIASLGDGLKRWKAAKQIE
ncbi:Mss4-like protein [Leptodontidium sp. 2 PMI_412]|nr:Mss4-like protein [Leptodontidium sp. 2 PMI_412]